MIKTDDLDEFVAIKVLNNYCKNQMSCNNCELYHKICSAIGIDLDKLKIKYVPGLNATDIAGGTVTVDKTERTDKKK
ncbi:hypothetical protein [Thomasclavelia sp.]|uniref:hypothetical protein n=1 Tax=Thomasclavelia sp. TaxID=3025757 RepID=UPI0025CF410F|nr:hypothetical protein [Thomasclavelia sp.]